MIRQHTRIWSEAAWILFGGDRAYSDFSPDAHRKDTVISPNPSSRPGHPAPDTAEVSDIEACADDNKIKTPTVH